MQGKNVKELTDQEREELQRVLDSVSDASQPLVEVLSAWEEGTALRLRRAQRGLTPQEKQHETNVANQWETALAIHIKKWKPAAQGQPWKQAPWSLGMRFLTAHSDESPLRALKKLRPLVEAPEQWKAGQTAQLAGAVVSMFLYGVMRLFDLSTRASWLVMVFLLSYLPLIAAKPLRCALIRRSCTDEEALEQYCDALAGSSLKAMPRLCWAVPAVLIALTVYLFHFVVK